MLGCISIPTGGNCFDKIIAYGGILDFFADFVSYTSMNQMHSSAFIG